MGTSSDEVYFPIREKDDVALRLAFDHLGLIVGLSAFGFLRPPLYSRVGVRLCRRCRHSGRHTFAIHLLFLCENPCRETKGSRNQKPRIVSWSRLLEVVIAII